MSYTFHVFSNIRMLRSQARKTSLEVLEDILEKFTSIVEDRRHEEESDNKDREERKTKIESIREQLIADGINPKELLLNNTSFSSKRKTSRNPCNAK